MNKKTPIIVVNKNTPHVVETFSRIGNVIALETKEVTKSALQDADVLIVRSETKVNKDLLEGSPVRFVGTVTIGTDHIDTQYLQSQGITFASAPGSNANSVAEYVTAALLYWSQSVGQSLNGKTIGVVGVGNVGKKVARFATSLGLNVLLNDPPLARETGDARFQSLDKLMDADIVTLHVPLTKFGPDSTYHLFNESRIKAMKQNSVLINTSRGGVVETNALRAALSSGHLSCGILDVWEHEPVIDIGLLTEVNIGTPHIAGYSLDGKLNALSMVFHDVCRHLGISEKMEGKNSNGTGDLRIPVLQNFSDPIEIVSYAIQQAYDIEYDDFHLRKIASLPEQERGAYFMNLRSGYRTRKEFFHWTVCLLPEQISTANTLRDFGFNIEIVND